MVTVEELLRDEAYPDINKSWFEYQENLQKRQFDHISDRIMTMVREAYTIGFNNGTNATISKVDNALAKFYAAGRIS